MQTEQQYHHVSVIDPISPSIAWVKQVLFSPFDLERWFVIGFCAWLAGLGSRGANFNYNTNKQNLPNVQEWISANLHWLIPVVVAAIITITAIAIVVLWLSSRGRFMLLHCVRHSVGEIRRPWRHYRYLGHSLFLFRLFISALGFIAFMIPIGLFLATLWPLSNLKEQAILVPVLLLIPVMVLLTISFATIGKLTKDFVIPLMVLRQTTCTTAWRELLALMGSNKGRFLLYLLFQLVILVAIHTVLIAIFIVTCGLACCLFIIPYLGTVLTLPIPIFHRSYSLFYLRQYGPAYDVFYQPPQAPPVEHPVAPESGPPSAEETLPYGSEPPASTESEQEPS